MCMKVLIVANYNPGSFSPFVLEQVESLEKLDIEFDFFGIIGKGPIGYLKNLPALKRKIKEYHPDLIHAHYGLSGLLATLQRNVPVVVTYHGSDIHSGGMIQRLSKLTMKRSAHNIIVAKHLKEMVGDVPNYSIIHCGVDDKTFNPMPMKEVRKLLGWSESKRYVLFAGSFDREVKNPSLAKEAIDTIDNCELIELKGYNRHQVNLLLNAVDCLLMTSNNEGSPQIIKEAMCCNTPIVSVNVGDVADVCGDAEGCFICQRDPKEISEAIFMAISRDQRTDGRQLINRKRLSLDGVAAKINEVYNQVIQ